MAKRKRPRTVRTVSEERILEAIDDATDRVDDAFPAEFESAYRFALRATDMTTLETAIRFGDERTAERAFRWTDIEAQLGDAMAGDGKTAKALVQAAEAGVDMAKQIASGVQVDLPDDLLGDALNAARKQIGKNGLDRARDLTVESRKGIRALVREAFKPSRSITEIADALKQSIPTSQIAKTVALNERQAEALGKKIYGWMNADPPMAPRDLQRLIDQERQRMIVSRAESVARTEAVAAANQGMLDTWKEGKRTGKLAGFLKEWVAREVGACPRCRAFDDKVAEMDQPFVSDLGERAMAPEIHPGGYCGMRLRRKPS